MGAATARTPDMLITSALGVYSKFVHQVLPWTADYLSNAEYFSIH